MTQKTINKLKNREYGDEKEIILDLVKDSLEEMIKYTEGAQVRENLISFYNTKSPPQKLFWFYWMEYAEKIVDKEIAYDIVPEFHIGKKRADFAFPTFGLVVECDGRDFHDPVRFAIEDEKRTFYFQTLGWEVRRLRNGDIWSSPEDCLCLVIAWLLNRSDQILAKHRHYQMPTYKRVSN